jgi:hypothetical protein
VTTFSLTHLLIMKNEFAFNLRKNDGSYKFDCDAPVRYICIVLSFVVLFFLTDGNQRTITKEIL